MKTVLTLAVQRAARSLARIEGKALGQVVSELARRGLRPAALKRRDRAKLPTFNVPADAPPITSEMVREALDG